MSKQTEQEITYPHVPDAAFRPWGAGWVVAIPSDECDEVLSAGGITVTKADGTTTRRLVTGVKVLRNGSDHWTHKGRNWSALATKVPAEDRPARQTGQSQGSANVVDAASIQAQIDAAVQAAVAAALAAVGAPNTTPAMNTVKSSNAGRKTRQTRQAPATVADDVDALLGI
jgi:hypothetical protein